MLNPTPYPDVNALLDELRSRVQKILGNHFVGMYLYGSLALGDFDRASDIDFLVVTDVEVSGDQFSALQEMHTRLATSDSYWATDLEGAYLSLNALRRYDPAHALHPQLERGSGNTLTMENHARVIERHVLRERGIVVIGPPLENQIDPISPNELRQSIQEILEEWIVPLLDDPSPFHSRGGQAYTVLSLCRVLYTLDHGTVVSKPAAARWAQTELGERWIGLIDRALEGRQNPQGQVERTDVQETLEFGRFTLKRSQLFRVR